MFGFSGLRWGRTEPGREGPWTFRHAHVVHGVSAVDFSRRHGCGATNGLAPTSAHGRWGSVLGLLAVLIFRVPWSSRMSRERDDARPPRTVSLTGGGGGWMACAGRRWLPAVFMDVLGDVTNRRRQPVA